MRKPRLSVSHRRLPVTAAARSPIVLDHIANVLRRATATAVSRRSLGVVPQVERDPDDLVALGHQARGGNRLPRSPYRRLLDSP